MDELGSLIRDVEDLKAEVRQQNRTIAGIQHYLKVAADYQNEDPTKVAVAIQAALLQAAKYEGRKTTRRHR